jgi:hypothetical protein
MPVIEDLASDWRRLDERIEGLFTKIEVVARQDAGCEGRSVPAIGPIISSAMAATIGAGDVFTKRRDFAVWLGVVRKQTSTGDVSLRFARSEIGSTFHITTIDADIFRFGQYMALLKSPEIEKGLRSVAAQRQSPPRSRACVMSAALPPSRPSRRAGIAGRAPFAAPMARLAELAQIPPAQEAAVSAHPSERDSGDTKLAWEALPLTP